jgi:hypothetical protein
VLCENSNKYLASAERDDAANRVVGGHTHGDTIAGHHLDAETAHAAAQLGKHFVALVALHAVKAAAVDGHNRPLHINQIILAQVLSFQSKIVPYRVLAGKLNNYKARTAAST